MKTLIIGGGTGGHFYPALSLLKFLKENCPDDQFGFVLGTKPVEDHFAEKLPSNVKVYRLAGTYFSPRKPSSWLKIIWNFFLSLFLIIRFRPQAIVLFGGYLSLFPGILGKLMGIRILIHEQNVTTGKVISILSHFADAILTTFPETASHIKQADKITHIGIPTRFHTLEPVGAKKSGRPVILFMGGSQGAASLNTLFLELIRLPEWTSQYYSILLGGNQVKEEKQNNFQIIQYTENIEKLYQQTSCMICRSGASTLAELLFYNKPAILVPYPFAYNNHQQYNAESAAQANPQAITVIKQKDLNSSNVLQTIERLVTQEELTLHNPLQFNTDRTLEIYHG